MKEWINQIEEIPQSSLSKYAEVFQNNDITGHLLLNIEEKDLESMNITSWGHRTTILQSIEDLKAKYRQIVSQTYINSNQESGIESLSAMNQCLYNILLNAKINTTNNNILEFNHLITPLRKKIPFDFLIIIESYKIITPQIFQEILNGTTQFIITGPPGEGKSMMLYYILWKLLTEENSILYLNKNKTLK